MDLAVGVGSASSPIGQLIVLVAIAAFFGFLTYAFLTRYRGDWDGALRRLTDRAREQDHGDHDGKDQDRGERDT